MCCRAYYLLVLFLVVLAGGACKPSRTVQATVQKPRAEAPAASLSGKRFVRSTGVIEAVRSFTVVIPQVTGQNGRLTLVRIVRNGVDVKVGDILAEFDRTQQEDNERDAAGKFDDLSHQVEQRVAQNRADAERRRSDFSSAQGDLEKADLELRKGPILSEIDRQKNESKRRDALAHVASLKRSNGAHDRADAAALRILELQRDRQKVALDRSKGNLEKLVVRAPLGGMVAHEMVWRNNSMGHPQEGDQLWIGEPLVKIFDASEMKVRIAVGEPDGACLAPGTKAEVRLDAYPELVLPAHYESSSPVAAGAVSSPIKTFSARFLLDVRDPRVLPDLSAAVAIQVPPAAGKGN